MAARKRKRFPVYTPAKAPDFSASADEVKQLVARELAELPLRLRVVSTKFDIDRVPMLLISGVGYVKG